MGEKLLYPPVTRKVAGVFKGGGARGIVYAGALRELRARGIWFESVAGSSAGAITAALVAIGTDPDELAAAADEGLRQVPRNLLRGFVPWLNRACYRTDKLQAWLENRLRAALRRPEGDEAEITFSDLDAAGMIELNVVAMDLHHKQPIVFNHQTTPLCSVASAVVASCAIPVAMPAGRVVVPCPTGGHEVHRLVDGGAWANYPAFVYTDASFRSYHGLAPLADGIVTVGFVIEGKARTDKDGPVPRPLDPPPGDQIRSASSTRSPFDRGSAARVGPIGALLSWGGLRFVAAIVVPAVACVLMFAWLLDHLFTLDDGGGDNLLPVLLFLGTGLLVLATAAFVMTAALVQLRFAHEAIDVGLPSLKAALSVGTGVPRWVGHADGDRVIRLWPPAGIATTSFKPSPEQISAAIADAEITAGAQLDRIFPDLERVGLDVVQRTEAISALERTRKEYKPSRWALVRLALLFALCVFTGLALILNYENALLFLIVYPALLWVGVKLVRAMIHRRQANQGLLDDEPLTGGIIPRLIFGAYTGFGGILMVAASDEDLTSTTLDEATTETLWGAAFGATVTVVGFGAVVAALGRAIAIRHHRRYLQEISAVFEEVESVSGIALAPGRRSQATKESRRRRFARRKREADVPRARARS